MSSPDHPVWTKLADYCVGPPDASLSFVDRLARENRWSVAYAERVMNEYKRFCFLAIVAGHEVTPSDAVDQAWHLHLTYSRDYWGRFCPDVLGAKLHHGPTAGGQVERTRYYDQYAATLKSYEVHFDEPSPPDIWPDAKRRFVDGPTGVRVLSSDVLILDRRYFAIACTAIMAAISTAILWETL
jgi:hypothetical protein